MRLSLFVAVLCVVGMFHADQAHPTPALPANSGRYQLVPASIPYQTKTGEAFEQALFLLDTQTGMVRRYQRSITIVKDGKTVDEFTESFSYVPADGIAGFDRKAALHKFLQQLEVGPNPDK
jgi:hypothetical protein